MLTSVKCIPAWQTRGHVSDLIASPGAMDHVPRFVSEILPAKKMDGSSSSRIFVHVLPCLPPVPDARQRVITSSKAATAQI